MFEQESLSQILDILGNKNRRRILDLLHNKPCFVTEISDKLSLNPKAVIEHLSILQKEDVIASYLDEKRRKYYYLIQDIHLSLKLDPKEKPAAEETEPLSVLPLADTIMHLRHLLVSRKELFAQIEALEKDIDRKMEELVANSTDVFKDDTEPEVLLALIYNPLTPIELADACGRPIPEVTAALRSLSAKGYIESEDGRYALRRELTEKIAE